MTRWKHPIIYGPSTQTDLFTFEEILQPKPKSSMYKILKALETAGHFGLLNWELQEVAGLSWHRRVGDLRALGHDIKVERVNKGQYRYTLEHQ